MKNNYPFSKRTQNKWKERYSKQQKIQKVNIFVDQILWLIFSDYCLIYNSSILNLFEVKLKFARVSFEISSKAILSLFLLPSKPIL